MRWRQWNGWIRTHRLLLFNALFWLVIGLDAFATTWGWAQLTIQPESGVVLMLFWAIPGFLFCAWMQRRFLCNPGWSVLRSRRRTVILLVSMVLFVSLLIGVAHGLMRLLPISADQYASTDLQFAAKTWIVYGGMILRLLIWAGFFLLFLNARDLQHSEVRRGQQEKALVSAQLRFLTSAFQPHFLLNGLTAIASCRHDPDAVQEGSNALADYLRYTIAKPELLEPLQLQLDALEGYIGVQELRFAERFRSEFMVDKDVLQLQVPRFLLQPLVENAFKHGSPGFDGLLRIQVRCRCEGQRLILSVANTGCWQGSHGGGYGLEAIRQQLDLFYGSAATLRVSNNDDLTYVTVELPVRQGQLSHA
ncbi:histidine kinase-/ DNA gyrase B-/ and HSP90-likeATPase family protein [Synechococcus sp. RS9909]|nr:hypothetical LytS, regulator of cell autolysis [Synechococcus sp. RS9917]QNI79754.1 histidine kinase-/ DNA gyrase B-/ and HSP90-likeATPase family protein [Synechococcus sp. RS9909]